jgi:Fur family transcriptional regulator, ferric uptake regulator
MRVATIEQMAEIESTAWVEHALAALGQAGYRSGGARRRVVELLGSEDCALTALEIDRRLEEVGRASVYRAIEQLEELRLVQRVDLGGEAAAYERVDPAGHHHHHIVCDRCGKVVPFEDRDLELAINRVSRRTEFEVADHEVTLRGTCAHCSS